MTASKPASDIQQTEDKLQTYERRLVHEKAAVVTAAETLDTAKSKVTYTEQAIVSTRVDLGKLKLTAAIALIEDVYSKAPAGSAAANDISGLTERLMRARMQATLAAMPYEGIFAGTVTGRMSMSAPQVGSNLPKPDSITASTIANMQTNVGAGQPRQAKPSPVQFKAGDKVRAISNAGDRAAVVGKVYTVERVRPDHSTFHGGMVYTTCGVHQFASRWELATDIRVGDKVKLQPNSPTGVFTSCTDTGILTVFESSTSYGNQYIRVKEHLDTLSGHRYIAAAFQLA